MAKAGSFGGMGNGTGFGAVIGKGTLSGCMAVLVLAEIRAPWC